MKIIALQHEEQHKFLLHVLDAFSRGGMPASDLPLAADVYVAVVNAKELSTHLSNAKVAEIKPDGLAIEVPVPQNYDGIQITD